MVGNKAKKKLTWPDDYIAVDTFLRQPETTAADAEAFLGQYYSGQNAGCSQEESVRGYVSGAYGYSSQIGGGIKVYAQLAMQAIHGRQRAADLYPAGLLKPRAGEAVTNRSIDEARKQKRLATARAAGSTSSAPQLGLANPTPPVVKPMKLYLTDPEEEDSMAKRKELLEKLDRERKEENIEAAREKAREVTQRVARTVGETMMLDETTTPRLSEVTEGIERVCQQVIDDGSQLSETALLEGVLDIVKLAPSAPWTRQQIERLYALESWDRIEETARLYGSLDSDDLDANDTSIYIQFFIPLDDTSELKRILAGLKVREEESPQMGRRKVIRQIEAIIEKKAIYAGLTETTLDMRQQLSLSTDVLSRFLDFSPHFARYTSVEDALAGRGGNQRNVDVGVDDLSSVALDLARHEGEDEKDFEYRRKVEVAWMEEDLAALRLGGGVVKFVAQAGHPRSHGSILINSKSTMARVRVGILKASSSDQVGTFETIIAALHRPNINLNPAGHAVFGTIDQRTRKRIEPYGTRPQSVIVCALSPPSFERARGQVHIASTYLNASNSDSIFSDPPPFTTIKFVDVFGNGKKGSRQNETKLEIPIDKKGGFEDRLEKEIIARQKLGGEVAILCLVPEVLGILGVADKTRALGGKHGLGGVHFGMEPKLINFRGHNITVFMGRQPNRDIYYYRREARIGNAIIFAMAATYPAYASSMLQANSTYPMQRTVLQRFIDEFQEEFLIARHKSSYTNTGFLDADPISSFPSPVLSVILKPIPPQNFTNREMKVLVKPLGKPLTHSILAGIGIAKIKGCSVSIYEGTLDFRITAYESGRDAWVILPERSSKLKVCRSYLEELEVKNEVISELETKLKLAIENRDGILPVIANGRVKGRFWDFDVAGDSTQALTDVRTHPVYDHGTVQGAFAEGSTDSSSQLKAYNERLEAMVGSKTDELVNFTSKMTINAVCHEVLGTQRFRAVTNPNLVEQPAWDLMGAGPRIHEFLRELRQKGLGEDAAAIGELNNTPSLEQVLAYVGSKNKALDRVVRFDIAMLSDSGWKFMATPWKLSPLEANHDLSRSISRFASDAPEYRVQSAKLLATYVLTISGTPIIYQGQEIDMVNIPEEIDIDKEYKDCDTIGLMKEGRLAAEQEGSEPGLIEQQKKASSSLHVTMLVLL
ncbi:hypothetical protein JCM5353_008657 [Sporobolomyces roseus]